MTKSNDRRRLARGTGSLASLGPVAREPRPNPNPPPAYAGGTGSLATLRAEPFPIELEIDDDDIVYERVVERVVDDADIVEEDLILAESDVVDAELLADADELAEGSGLAQLPRSEFHLDDDMPAEPDGDYVIAMSDMFAERAVVAVPDPVAETDDDVEILEGRPAPRMTSVPPRFTTTTPGVMRRQPR